LSRSPEDPTCRTRNWASYLHVVCEAVLGVRIFCNLESRTRGTETWAAVSLCRPATPSPGPPGTCVCPSSICSGSMADPANHSHRILVLENKKSPESPGRSPHQDARMEFSPAADPAPHPHLGAGAVGAAEEQDGGETLHDPASATGQETPRWSQVPKRSWERSKRSWLPVPKLLVPKSSAPRHQPPARTPSAVSGGVARLSRLRSASRLAEAERRADPT
jgi:hypothetical protein